MNDLQIVSIFDGHGLIEELAWKSSLILLAACFLHVVIYRRRPLLASVGWNAVFLALLILPLTALAPPLQIDYLADSTTTTTNHFLETDAGNDVSVVDSPAVTDHTYTPNAPNDVTSAAQRPIRLMPSLSSAVTQAPDPEEPSVTLGRCFAFMYLCGVCLMGTRLLLSAWKLRQLLHRSKTVTTMYWTAAVDHWREKLRIRRRVKICHSSEATVPFTCGWWRPTIVLPSDFTLSATPTECRVVALHELTHIARFDCAWHCLLRTLQVLYWWQPLVWLAGRQSGQVRESVCDQFCVGTIGRPQQYADVLLRVAQAIARPIQLGVGLAMVRVPRISRRLHEITACSGLKRNRPTRIVTALVLSLIVMGTGILGAGIADIVAQTPAHSDEDPDGAREPIVRASTPPRHEDRIDDARRNEAVPTENEKQALEALEKLVGRNFTVNENGAVIQAVLGSFELSDESFEHVGQLKNLRTLYLHRGNVTDNTLQHLKGLVELRRLYLGETAIGDAGLEHLKGLTKLEYLHVGGTKVTGAGTSHLGDLTNLKILHLFNTKVDDGGLTNLRGLSKLQLVSLPPVMVTDDGVKKLQEAMPKLVIQGKPQWLVAHPDSAKQLAVSIAVPERDGKRIIDLRKPTSHFNVVVTNLTKRDLRLWETWNSWGYFNLSFDVLDDKGNVVNSIVKKPRGWTVNGVTWITVKPGEHFTLRVDFDPDEWIWGGDIGSNFPVYIPYLVMMDREPEFNVRLRAVFKIIPDWETIEHNVWTGTVRSTPDNFVIRHSPRKVVKGDPNAIGQDPRLTDVSAISIATPKMSKKFPESFERCKPYRAKLADGIWHVYGTTPGGAPGGTPEAHVRDANGIVLKVFHSQ
jgi:beta-lactamase regulating signal transducer with metallopeptidase domain